MAVVWKGGQQMNNESVSREKIIATVKGAIEQPENVLEDMGRINEMHDQLQYSFLQRIDQQLQQETQLPPFSHCWVDMGSGGRQERTLWTDQDNGIIYECDSGDEEAIRYYLSNLAKECVVALDHAGYPLCSGFVMATNPRWMRSLEGWKENWTTWGNRVNLDDIRYMLISFDVRSIYGDNLLANKLKIWMAENTLPESGEKLMIHTLKHPLPMGKLGNLLTKRYGNHAGMYHLKEGGYYQLVGIVRMLALHAGITAPSTKDRIYQLTEQKYITRAEKQEWEDCLSFFLYHRLVHHYQLIQKAQPIDDYIDLSKWDSITIKQLKAHVKFLLKQQKRWLKWLEGEGWNE
jgi:CBS domain-containing protein